MASAPWLGSAVLTASALLYDVLLALVRRADRAYPSTDPVESTWWFGYARDVTNAFGVLAYGVAFTLLGFTPARALLAGALLALVTYVLDYVIGRAFSVKRTGFVLAGILIAMTIVIIVWRRPLAGALDSLVHQL